MGLMVGHPCEIKKSGTAKTARTEYEYVMEVSDMISLRKDGRSASGLYNIRRYYTK